MQAPPSIVRHKSPNKISDRTPPVAVAASSSSLSSSRAHVSSRNITVRFELNDFDTVAQVYPESTAVADVLEEVAAKFQLLPKYLSIKQKFGSKIAKTVRLQQLCSNDFGIVDVQLGLSDLANHINESIHIEHEKIKLDTNLYYRQNLLPDFISVSVQPDIADDLQNMKRIIVEIINKPIIKPFLGGYLNKQTGFEYHNAYTQTGPLKEQIMRYSAAAGLLVTRDTQTTEKAFRLSGGGDDELCRQGKSATDDKTSDMENRMAIVIQRAFRLFLWKRFIRNLSIDRRSRLDEDNELKEQRSVEDGSGGAFDTIDIHVMNSSPRCRSDFKQLELKIGKWKESRIEFIKQHFVADKIQQKTELAKLLEDEIKLLNEVEKKRNKIRKEAHDKYMDKLLDKMGAPVKWIGYKNLICEMDLLQCQKIRKLTTLYHQLKTPPSSSAMKVDRIEFVGELHKILAEEQHSKPLLLEELLDLLRREQKMLLANIDRDTIDSLRRRQNELFRNFIASHKTFEPTTTMVSGAQPSD